MKTERQSTVAKGDLLGAYAKAVGVFELTTFVRFVYVPVF